MSTKQNTLGLRKWHSFVTKPKLQDAWGKLADGGGAGRDGVTPSLFAKNSEAEIRLINRRLRGLKYEFQPYAEILKSKGAGKNPRVISMPAVRDRIALRAMAAFLKDAYPRASTRLPQDVVAAVVKELQGGDWTYFVKLDVKEFYPSILHSFLHARMSQVISNDAIVELFMRAVSTRTVARTAPRPAGVNTRGIPQGLAISNGLAELTIGLLDDHLSKQSDVIGFRFVDDILILSRSRRASDRAVREIRELAKLAGLEVHDDANAEKTKKGPLSSGFDFLGYSFEWPRITVRKGSLTKLESRISRSFTAYKYALERNPSDVAWQIRSRERLQWHLDLVISGFVLDGRRVGWLAYFSQMRNLKLLRRLDDIVERKARRFGVGDMQFKSFVKVYRLVSSRRVDSSGYVPNFDDFEVEAMREILVKVFNMTGVARLTDDEVRGRFKRRVKRLSKELESDVPSYR